MTLNFKGNDIVVKQTKSRRLRLTVDPLTRKVVLFKPNITSMDAALKFLDNHELWLKKVLDKLEPITLEYEDGAKIRCLGSIYSISIISSEIENVYLDNDKFVVMTSKDSTQEDIVALIDAFYYKTLEFILNIRVDYYQKLTGLVIKSWRIKKVKSTWGWCNTKNKTIQFNLLLAKNSYDAIDFVIVHELGHLLYPNHGKEFKSYMDEYYPEWRKVSKTLSFK